MFLKNFERYWDKDHPTFCHMSILLVLLTVNYAYKNFKVES